MVIPQKKHRHILHLGQWWFPPWIRVPHASQSLVKQQSDMSRMQTLTGSFEDLRVSTYYNFLTRFIDINGYYLTPGSMEGMAFLSHLPNLPLFLFLTALLANTYLLHKAISDRKPA